MVLWIMQKKKFSILKRFKLPLKGVRKVLGSQEANKSTILSRMSGGWIIPLK